MSWREQAEPDFHVMPFDDLIEHSIYDCVCHPVREMHDEFIVMRHVPLDDRPEYRARH